MPLRRSERIPQGRDNPEPSPNPQAEGSEQHSKPLFELGQVVATPGAIEALEAAGQEPFEFILRHVTGDWGQLGHYNQTELSDEEWKRGALATADDDKLNKWGVHKGGRIMSAYTTSQEVKFWIITEAEDDEGHRSATTLLLPSEY